MQFLLKEYFSKIYMGTAEELFRDADEALASEQRLFVVTANPETLMIGEDNSAFHDVLCKPRSVIVPDGIGVVRAAQRLVGRKNGRIAGVDLAAHLIAQAGSTGRSVYLFGAKEEVVSALTAQIREKYGESAVAGFRNGYGQNEDEVLAEVRALAPDVVLVALGIPRQELLLDKWYDSLEKGVLVGVGGSFDVLSGMKKRAPEFFLKHNLEWLYRILKEPKRFGRFFRSNVRFVFRVLTAKKG